MRITSELDRKSASESADRAARIFSDASKDIAQEWRETLGKGARAGGRQLEKMAEDARGAYRRMGDAAENVTRQEEQLRQMRERGAQGVEVQAARVKKARRDEARAIREAAAAYDDYESAARSAGDSAERSLTGGFRAAAGAAGGAGRDAAQGFVGGFAGASALARIGAAGGPIGLALAGAAALGVTAGKVLADNIASGLQQLQIRDVFQARLGVDDGTMERLGRGAGRALADGWGASVADNLRASQFAIQGGLIDSDATDAEIQQVISQMQGLSAVMEEDPQSIARGVRNFIRTDMVNDYEEAFDLLAAANAKGMNMSNDLLDTFEEYGTVFRKVGLDGADALGLINQMWEGGARNVDQAADTIKEFTNTVVDGSESTAEAFEALGFNAEDMQERFAQGGPIAREAFGQTLTALREVDDEVQRDLIGLALYKTKWEDIGKAIHNVDLSTARSELGELDGSVNELTDNLSEHVNQWDLLGRNINTTFADMKMWLADTTIGRFFNSTVPSTLNSIVSPAPPRGFSAPDKDRPGGPAGQFSLGALLPGGAPAVTDTTLTDLLTPPAALFGGALKSGPKRTAPTPMTPDSAASSAAAPSLPGAPTVPFDTTLPPGIAGMPSTAAIVAAENSYLTARHRVAEKQARVNQLEQSNVATADDVQDARNDLVQAQQQAQVAELRLNEVRANQFEQLTKTSNKFASQMSQGANTLSEVGAQIQEGFGISEGLAGIAENLVTFLASLAFAPVMGALAGVRDSFGGTRGGSGLVGGISGMFAPPQQQRSALSGGGGLGSSGLPASASLFPSAALGPLSGAPSLSSAGIPTPAAGGGGSLGTGPGVGQLEQIARRFNLEMSSGVRNEPGSFHHTGQAGDFVGTAADMRNFSEFISRHYGPHLAELIFRDPRPGVAPFTRQIDEGKIVGPGGGASGFFAGAGDHTDHVHAALRGTLPTGGGTGPGSGLPGLGGPRQSLGLGGDPRLGGGSGLFGGMFGGPAAPSQSVSGGRQPGQGLPASEGLGFGGGLIGLAQSAIPQGIAAAGMAGDAAGGMGGGSAAASLAAAAAQIGIDQLNRAAGAAGQYVGALVGGGIETFSLNQSALADPGRNWFGRLVIAAAGARPALANTAGMAGGEQNPAMAEGGKPPPPLDPKQAAQGRLGKGLGGNVNSNNTNTTINVTNQHERGEDGTGRDIQRHLSAGYTATRGTR